MLIWVAWLPGSMLTPLCGVPSTENVKKKEEFNREYSRTL